jgi:hypothetical protein
MPVYAQHGHGKSDRLPAAFDTGSLQGVIFGARNEKYTNMQTCLDALRTSYDVKLLFDPQFYVTTLVPASERFLPEYPYYSAGRTSADFVGPKKLNLFAKQTLDLQAGWPLDRIISPSVLFNRFDDKWCQIALNLASASLDYHAGLDNPSPLLLSLIIAEEALDSREELEGFLDQVTAWEPHGFYVIVARTESTYSQRYDSNRLAHLLYLTYILGSVNGFEVVNGYSDFCGPMLRAVASTAFATGWSQSLRQFHKRSFIRRKPGGQPPRLRYSSVPLLNSIMLGELQQAFEVDAMDLVLSNVPSDTVITSATSPDASTWNQRISELHHWEALQSIDVAMVGDASVDMGQMRNRLENASALYVALAAAGVVFERQENHLKQWIEALDIFAGMSGLDLE